MLVSSLVTGTLLCRRNRFVVEVELDSGEVVEAHCTNTGRMTSCCTPGWKVALSRAVNPNRKLKFTWELVHNGRGWIGINTHAANLLAEEAISQGVIPELVGWPILERERKYGKNSRIDILLRRGEKKCYIEVKNVTLLAADGMLAFPDAPSERARKHLAELADMVRAGHRAVMLFVIQRDDGEIFRPASEVDPAYGQALRQAWHEGVELLAYAARVSLEEIRLYRPVSLDPSCTVDPC